MLTRRLFIALAAAAAASVATPVFALGSLVDVELVDRILEQPLPTYSHNGAAWVAGQPGTRYAVRMSNRSGRRVLVVLSIDGINAVSGDTAAVGQTGYVLGPWQTTEITGWRKSLTEAAAFYFTALPDSYAARTDRPDNVGVIGVAVFRECVPERELSLQRHSEAAEPRVAQGSGEREHATDSRAAPATMAKAAGTASDERLGTGHGEREYAPTTVIGFERASERPAELVRIRYDSRDNLLALGVIRPRRSPVAPEPFPSFVPDPKG
jgi:hypothetical protein